MSDRIWVGWEVKEHEHQDCFKKSGDPLTVKMMDDNGV